MDKTVDPKIVDSKQKNRFLENLPKGFMIPKDEIGKLLLREYGAVFVARGGAIPPGKVIFEDKKDVSDFQKSIEIEEHRFGTFDIELQMAAMTELKAAAAEAMAAGMSITPRGADSGRRNYRETEKLWSSRVKPGMKYWVAAGRVTVAESERIQALSPVEQVPEILRLEMEGIYFAKDLSKSIIYSVAPPGTTQHLSLLAFDVAEFDNAKVRSILAKHFWYQTVTTDLPHFTFLGVPEKGLPKLGLKKITALKRSFWVPDL